MQLMQALMKRLMPLFGGLFASHVETGILLEQAEQIDALEQRARRFEAEGKPELATLLRQQIGQVHSEDPGRRGLRILENFEDRDAETPALLTSEPPEPKTPARKKATTKSRGRRSARRSSRPVADESSPPPTDPTSSCE